MVFAQILTQVCKSVNVFDIVFNFGLWRHTTKVSSFKLHFLNQNGFSKTFSDIQISKQRWDFCNWYDELGPKS